MRIRIMSIIKNIFKTKSRYIKVIDDENIEERSLERNLSLFDLICIGIGGTVGSGVFVLSPIIAHDYAGPDIVWSWLIAGIACLCSACAYAELSGRYPQAGSAYVYANVALGELPAVIAGWCLSLEYGISGAAVARSWGDKLISWIESLGGEVHFIFNPGYNINIIAALLQLSCMLLLLKGLNIGKLTVNIFTIAKVFVVFFIIIVGLSLYNPSNITHWNPYGVSGILKGSTACFFGYIGFDEVCCLAAEAKNPNKNLPKAVFGTVISITLLYCLSGLALVGMQDYTIISTSGGFAGAFEYNNMDWAGNFVAAGELITLPLVVLVSFLAQPRLFYAMSMDKQLPKIFAKIDEHGNLYNSIVVCGIICTLVALLTPFTYLDDMISAGVLISFNLTNSSLIIIRRSTEEKQSLLKCQKYVGFYNICIAIFSFFFIELIENSNNNFNVYLGFAISLVFCLYFVYKIFGLPECDDSLKDVQFRVPFVPLLPLFGIMINYMLIAQLSQRGIFMILGYLGFAVSFYFANGFNRLFNNNNSNISVDLQLSNSINSKSNISNYDENLHINLLSSIVNNKDNHYENRL